MSDLPDFVISFDAPKPPSPTSITFGNDDFYGKRKASNPMYSEKTKRRAFLPTGTPNSRNAQPGLLPSGSLEQHSISEHAISDWCQGGKITDNLGNSNDDNFSTFVYSVLAEECAFWQLSPTLFIANGWDNIRKTPTRHWYHLQSAYTKSGRSVVCLCPGSKQGGDCFHERFLKELGDKHFPTECVTGQERDTYLFSRYAVDFTGEETIFYNIFSVSSQGRLATTKTRAIVEHQGDDNGSGSWICSKDAGVQNCGHIIAAMDSLQKHLQCDESAEDVNKQTDFLLYDETLVRTARHDRESISYKPIPVPLWATIPGDKLSDGLCAADGVQKHFPLDLASSCNCNQTLSRSFYDARKSTSTTSCKVYGFTRMWTGHIQVQKCASCKYGWIGPDGLEAGYFNWNNRVLFTHELLNDYTNAFTTSETPFVAWVTVVARRYYCASMEFVSERTFRSVWFAYARLLELQNDMACPKCGPTPKATIWDGITLSFSRKHLLLTLQPPTTIHSRAPHRQSRYPVKPQHIANSQLRRQIISVLGLASTSPIELGRKDRTITSTIRGLNDIDPSLALIFGRCFSVQYEASCGGPMDLYRELFLQIAAEESALQMTTRPVLHNLETFIEDSTLRNSYALTMVPCLYNVLKYEFSCPSQTISEDMLGVCKWLLRRGREILESLLKGKPKALKDVTVEEELEHWDQTGCCYAMPQIRYRPFYPRLKKDGQLDDGCDKQNEGCNKHFKMYGRQSMTGGLMVAWCTHIISYGFHCIPKAEGRNEVFSAIYTRWEQAPEIVIYDYACNLQPYCMAREPDFFADTTFLVDLFHSTGHKKCGKAASLSNYLSCNPELLQLNSSAAECGNGGLRRIRKSVSYMSQQRAIIYTKVYLSFWNRTRIRELIGWGKRK